MQDKSGTKNRRTLRGMDPGSLIDVLGDPVECPEIPGWTVVKLAGTGGSGFVWKAIRNSDGMVGAIKFAPAGDLGTVERIEHEAGALKSIDNPNVIRLIETGTVENETESPGFFLAMEFIEGNTLSEEIPSGGIAPEKAFSIFFQIASAVSAAHDSAILHRDLKPSNVMIDRDGNARLGDFGLARPVHQRVQQLSLTRAGLVAGTAEYLPPEAYLRSYEPNVSGDVYSLGVILYEILTGSPPRGAWQPASSRAGVDIRIDEIIRRAIDPDPEKRWQEVSAMARELEEITASQPRYSGAPVLSFPVQVTDFFWTLNGLFILVASTSSLLVLAKSKFTLPFDFVSPYGALAGAFHALFWLLLFSIPVSLWQIARLRIFRSVPMREALPSPFGLKLGTGKTSAILVFITQICCLVLPTITLFYFYVDGCLQWLRPDSPPWVSGLSMIRWDSREMLSIWLLPEAGKDYWLVESFGIPGHPLSETVSRLHFIPAYLPGLMVLCAFLLCSAILLTAGLAGKRWLARGRMAGTFILGAVCTAAIFLASRIHALAHHHANLELNVPAQHWGKNQMLRKASVMSLHILRGTEDGSAPAMDAEMLGLYADTVDYRDAGLIPRGEIPLHLASQPYLPCKRVCHPHSDFIELRDDQNTFTVSRSAMVYTDLIDPESSSRAFIARLWMDGSIHGRTHIEITRERYTETEVYTAENRTARPEEIEAWGHAFSAALENPGHSALRQLFHPMDESGDGLQTLFSSLENARGFVLVPTPTLIRTLPGGRSLVALELENPATGILHRWQAELALIGGSWKCLHLAFRRQ